MIRSGQRYGAAEDMGNKASGQERHEVTRSAVQKHESAKQTISQSGAEGCTTLTTTMPPALQARAAECMERAGRAFVRDELMAILHTIDPGVPGHAMASMTCETLRMSIRTAIVEKNLYVQQVDREPEPAAAKRTAENPADDMD